MKLAICWPFALRTMSLGSRPAREAALSGVIAAKRAGTWSNGVTSRPTTAANVANAKIEKMKLVTGPAATTSERVTSDCAWKRPFEMS